MAQYYVSKDGQQIGPFSVLQIKDQIGKGQLMMTDYIYDDSKSDWVMLLSFDPLSAVLISSKPNLPPPPMRDSKVEVAPSESFNSFDIDMTDEDLDVFEKTIIEPLEDFNLDADDSNEVEASSLDQMEKTIVEFSKENLKQLDEVEEASPMIEDTVSEYEMPLEPEVSGLDELDVMTSEAKGENLATEEPFVDFPPMPAENEPKVIEKEATQEKPMTPVEPPANPPEVGRFLNYGSAEGESQLEPPAMTSLGPIALEELNPPDIVDTSEKPLSSKVSDAFSTIEGAGVKAQIQQIKNLNVTEKEKAREVTRVLQEQVEPFDSEWFLLRDRNKYGPYTYADVLNMLEKGFIFGYDYVWTSRLPSWKKISALEAFSKKSIETNRNLSSPNLNKGLKKRRHKRVNYGQSIFVHDNKQVWRSKSVQISEGGCGVIMANCNVKEGEKVFLHFKPGDGVPPFNATCSVRGVSPYSGQLESASPLSFYSLQFEKISTNPGTLVAFLSGVPKVG